MHSIDACNPGISGWDYPWQWIFNGNLVLNLHPWITDLAHITHLTHSREFVREILSLMIIRTTFTLSRYISQKRLFHSQHIYKMLTEVSLPSPHLGQHPNTRHTLLYFLCGNPGYISYYVPFFARLRALLNDIEAKHAHKVTFTIAGRTSPGFDDADHSPPFNTTTNPPYNVEAQIQVQSPVSSFSVHITVAHICDLSRTQAGIPPPKISPRNSCETSTDHTY